MIINLSKSGSHWYHPDGQSAHEVDRADGNGKRDTTLRDARKLGLFPSVTTVLKVWPKEGLTNWRIEQAILAALTLPRTDKEPIDAFVKRVVADMDRERDEAARVGTFIHWAVATRVAGGHWPALDEATSKWQPFFDAWEPWIVENLKATLISESVLVNSKDGYAGCVDWVGLTNLAGRSTVDFKNQSVKGADARFHDTWLMQLVAYDDCLPGPERNSLISVVFNRDKPEPPYYRVWGSDEVAEAQDNWDACLAFWKAVNDYYP